MIDNNSILTDANGVPLTEAESVIDFNAAKIVVSEYSGRRGRRRTTGFGETAVVVSPDPVPPTEASVDVWAPIAQSES